MHKGPDKEEGAPVTRPVGVLDILISIFISMYVYVYGYVYVCIGAGISAGMGIFI